MFVFFALSLLLFILLVTALMFHLDYHEYIMIFCSLFRNYTIRLKMLFSVSSCWFFVVCLIRIVLDYRAFLTVPRFSQDYLMEKFLVTCFHRRIRGFLKWRDTILLLSMVIVSDVHCVSEKYKFNKT